MPYLNFPTPVNGFYDEELKKNKRGRIILYVKKAQGDNINKKNYISVSSSGGSYQALGVTTMLEPLMINTSIQWSEGGNIIEQIKMAYDSGIRNAKQVFAHAFKVANDAVNTIANIFGTEYQLADDHSVAEGMKKVQRLQVSPASSFKAFSGSHTSISLPTLEFVFPAEDFSSSHLMKAWVMLSYLLPNIGLDADGKQRASTQKNGKTFYSFMYESAPAGYYNPMDGFDSEALQGTFALDVGGQIVRELVPTNVAVQVSRIKVLTNADYNIIPNTKGSKLNMDEFYDAKQLGIIKACSDTGSPTSNMYVPAVIKVICTFEFARKVTILDYKNIIFDDPQFKNKEGALQAKAYKSDLTSPF